MNKKDQNLDFGGEYEYEYEYMDWLDLLKRHYLFPLFLQKENLIVMNNRTVEYKINMLDEKVQKKLLKNLLASEIREGFIYGPRGQILKGIERRKNMVEVEEIFQMDEMEEEEKDEEKKNVWQKWKIIFGW